MSLKQGSTVFYLKIKKALNFIILRVLAIIDRFKVLLLNFNPIFYLELEVFSPLLQMYQLRHDFYGYK
jgi:hypothetical protein